MMPIIQVNKIRFVVKIKFQSFSSSIFVPFANHLMPGDKKKVTLLKNLILQCTKK